MFSGVTTISVIISFNKFLFSVAVSATLYASYTVATLLINFALSISCIFAMLVSSICFNSDSNSSSETQTQTQTQPQQTFADYRVKIAENRKNHPYSFDNRNTPSYYLFCMARYSMLKEIISANPFNSTHFGWINFCMERMGYKNLMYLDAALSVHRDRFSTCYIDYIPEHLVQNTAEYYKWGRCGMCSGFFTGSAEYMFKVCDLIERKFLKYLDEGYGHADEQLYSPVYFENPDLFEHYYGDYQQMITNYVSVREAAEPPIYNFIRNSFKHGNFVKCRNACEFVIRSVQSGHCSCNPALLLEAEQTFAKCW